jgi:hypothetical protein
MVIRTIYILWFQGFNNAPEIVKNCVASWKYYNQNTWNIVLLDNNNLKNYINIDEIKVNKKLIKPCHLSDIIRCKLLTKYGGIWTDATSFCNRPLDEWILPFIEKVGFFAFRKPAEDRMLSNWFLYSNKENFIIEKWSEKTVEYYEKNGFAKTYFIHHYLFADLYINNKTFKNLWDKVPNFPANGYGPHFLLANGLFSLITYNIRYIIDKKISPIYKLTYKNGNGNNINKNSILNYIFSTINK